jgi:hypothetical protein
MSDDWKPNHTISPCCGGVVCEPCGGGRRDWVCAECGAGELHGIGAPLPPLGRLLTVREVAWLLNEDPYKRAAWVVEQPHGKFVRYTRQGPRITGGWVRLTMFTYAVAFAQRALLMSEESSDLEDLARLRQRVVEHEVVYLDALLGDRES